MGKDILFVELLLKLERLGYSEATADRTLVSALASNRHHRQYYGTSQPTKRSKNGVTAGTRGLSDVSPHFPTEHPVLRNEVYMDSPSATLSSQSVGTLVLCSSLDGKPERMSKQNDDTHE